MARDAFASIMSSLDNPLRATHLAIHFLTAGDLALAKRFGTLTGDATDKFAGLRVSRGPGGVPVLEDCPHRLILRRVVLVDEGGDHVCLTGDPLAVESSGAFEPLRLSQAGHLIRPTQPPEPVRSATRTVSRRGPAVRGRRAGGAWTRR